MIRQVVWLLWAALFLAACAPVSPPPGPKNLVRVKPAQVKALADDLEPASLEKAIEQSLAYLRRRPPERSVSLGPDQTTVQGLIFSLEETLRLVRLHGLGPALFQSLSRDFAFYAVPGEVLFTGYYEPLLQGRSSPEGRFTCPLHTPPQDLISLNLKDFGLKPRTIRGRVVGRKLVPYHDRSEIDQGVLDGQGLELAWVDPVEAFFLHIQGSGRVLFPDGRQVLVNYADQNGRSYVSLGQVMIERGLLARDGLSMQKLKQYLFDHPDEVQELLATNPSYVFFRVVEAGPLGCLGVPLTPGRSVALDRRIFPDAALGFIRTKKPVVDNGQVAGWQDFSRLVLIQDTGGAIKGPGRADLFFGHGPEAELGAGHMKKTGRLAVIVHKSVVK